MFLSTPRGTFGPVSGVALVLAIAGVTGCARVKPQEMQSELAKIRQEMAAGDSSLATRQAASEQQTEQRLASVTSRLDSLQSDLQSFHAAYNTTVQRMETAIRFNVPVHFDFAQATIRDGDRKLLDRFAEVVRHHYAGAKVTIEGFADPAGSVKFNQALGKERAEAVRDYLVTTDSLSGDQLNTVSYGKAKNRLVAPNAKGPGEAGLQNRRVAFVIDFAADSTATTTASR
ncbi:MAG: OmpA family protein [Gemmatimonadota bacterium]